MGSPEAPLRGHVLIPSIDLMDGKIVQLQHGERKSLEFADFEPWIRRFEKFPLVHVVDINGAMRTGENTAGVRHLSKRLRCQVGGGIASANHARQALDAGAKRVVVGSALVKDEKIDTAFAEEISRQIGREKLVFAVDTKQGLIAHSGWRKTAPITLEDAVRQLEPYCSAFLHTHIETEAGTRGFPVYVARDLVKITQNHIMVGGGISRMEEIQELDVLGVDAIVGMAIYTGALPV